jgi:hypothetical protein
MQTVLMVLKSTQTNDDHQKQSIPEKQDISIKKKNHGKRGDDKRLNDSLFVNWI